MANSNPFYTPPPDSLAPALFGLTNTLRGIGIDKRKKENEEYAKAETQRMRAEATAAFESGDPDQMMKFAAANPEFADAMNQAMSFKNARTRNNYFTTATDILTNPNPTIEDIEKHVDRRKAFLESQGAEDTQMIDALPEKWAENPAGTRDALAMSLAAAFPVRYKAWKEAYSPAAGKLPTPYTSEAKVIADVTNGYLTKEEGDAKINDIRNPSIKPVTNLGKLRYDRDNNNITEEEYTKGVQAIMNPEAKNMIELTREALAGGKESQAFKIIDRMAEDAASKAGLTAIAATEGKLEALWAAMDGEGTALAVYEGREVIDNVRNTFGVPIQERVRARVLEMAKKDGIDFNFIQPRVISASLSTSMRQQQKQVGSMDSFIQNMDTQITEVENMLTHIKRTDARLLNLPYREALTKLKGSGVEKVFEMFMTEISNEATKLSQSATQSVALLPEAARIKWESIHDLDLPIEDVLEVLKGTRRAGHIRMQSVQDAVKRTEQALSDVRTMGYTSYYDDQWKRQGGGPLKDSAGIR